jgi:hypothetical protein
MTKPCGHDDSFTLLDGSKRCGPCYYASLHKKPATKLVAVSYAFSSVVKDRNPVEVKSLHVAHNTPPEAIHDLVIWSDINGMQCADFASWKSEDDGLWVIKNRYSTRPTPYKDTP